MADGSRTSACDVIFLIVAIPLFAFFGLHIPLLASFAWPKIRVPYIVAMPMLLGLEMVMADLLLFAGHERLVMLLSHAAFLLLVIFVSFLIDIIGNRRRLLDGPNNVESFAPTHMIFLLTLVFIPAIFKARAIAHAVHT